MYAGITLSKHSGKLFGTHQRIDRAARRQLIKNSEFHDLFPMTKDIINFEGLNGPDGIKRKSPSQDEPWHFINPLDDNDREILVLIRDHYSHLVQALKRKDNERAAFEAAWLAHAVVDGLTPAHHYPYEERLVELREGEGKHTRNTIRKKLIMPGTTRLRQIGNNYKMWGPRGLYMTHLIFEMGVASVVASMRFNSLEISPKEYKQFETLGLDEWFVQTAKYVCSLDLFNSFSKLGWTPRLARSVRKYLAPTLVRSVAIIWYNALKESQS